MLHRVRTWAKERGNIAFHLGGGVGGKNDGLFFFKTGFSKLVAEFYTWRIILNQSIYDDCVRIWEERSKTKSRNVMDFFPAYRKQATVGQ